MTLNCIFLVSPESFMVPQRMDRPSGDHRGAGKAYSGLWKTNRGPVLLPSAELSINEACWFCISMRKNTNCFPSGEKLTGESTSETRNSGVPPNSGIRYRVQNF